MQIAMRLFAPWRPARGNLRLSGVIWPFGGAVWVWCRSWIGVVDGTYGAMHCLGVTPTSTTTRSIGSWRRWSFRGTSTRR